MDDFIKMLNAVTQLADFSAGYYKALVQQGLTDYQALELVKVVVASMIANPVQDGRQI